MQAHACAALSAPGIGATIAQATAHGDFALLLAATLAMVLAVVLLVGPIGWLGVILGLSLVVGLFYYLRIVVAVFSDLPEAAGKLQPPPFSLPLFGSYTLVVLAILLVWFGVYPSQLLNLIRAATNGLA